MKPHTIILPGQGFSIWTDPLNTELFQKDGNPRMHYIMRAWEVMASFYVAKPGAGWIYLPNRAGTFYYPS